MSLVSIHAPVKGATMDDWPPALRVRVSIHAPVKGATSRLADTLSKLRVSIHAPVKGATSGPECGRSCGGVSIHAPVKGATTCLNLILPRQDSFNPRPREGGDGFWFRRNDRLPVFQSTPP